MKIVVRTRHFPVFLMFFSSFVLFYPDKLKDLIIQVQIDKNNVSLYEALAKEYNIKLVLVNHNNSILNNCWAHMLFTSLQYDEVVSLDDDIVFINSGFFDALERIYKNNYLFNVLGFTYDNPSVEKTILASYCVYKKGINIDESCFLDMEESMKKYTGVDTGKFVDMFPCGFLNNYMPTRKNEENSNFNVNPYFIHVGSVSCRFNMFDGLRRDV